MLNLVPGFTRGDTCLHKALPIVLMLLLIYSACNAATSFGAIHSAPVVITGYKVKYATRFPIPSYRLFRTAKDGSAVAIPFQIDEINEWGDYVLDRGKDTNKATGN